MTPRRTVPRKHHVGWLIILILTTTSLSIPLITARREVHRLQADLTQLPALQRKVDTLCEITDGQSRILAMNLPGTLFEWSPPLGELCRSGEE